MTDPDDFDPTDEPGYRANPHVQYDEHGDRHEYDPTTGQWS